MIGRLLAIIKTLSQPGPSPSSPPPLFVLAAAVTSKSPLMLYIESCSVWYLMYRENAHAYVKKLCYGHVNGLTRNDESQGIWRLSPAILHL